jgi:hypothetical protein
MFFFELKRIKQDLYSNIFKDPKHISHIRSYKQSISYVPYMPYVFRKGFVPHKLHKII